ncbi:hypothetical protein Golob_013123 [Gossypium lobatum]|uniref:Uncharacterized protein n=1 Tax=Gossypium lobatum TaxID=34289 RepID=A0A7J8LNI1_9ROSI|nr:hypothetical protein [Gossypium lobatum]
MLEHIFKDCPSITEIWLKLQIPWPDDIVYTSLQDWLNYIFSSLPNPICRIVTCVIWFIWSARNKLTHENKVILPQDIICRVESYIIKVDEPQRKLPAKRVGSERWRPSECHFHKLNFGTTFDGSGKSSCTKIVVKNWEGRVVASNTAVNLGRDLGFQEVLIEGEALSVIKKMQAYDKDGSLIGAYIYDDANRVVDILAKRGLKLGESTYLVGLMPFFAKDTAENDLCRHCLGDTKGHNNVPLLSS